MNDNNKTFHDLYHIRKTFNSFFNPNTNVQTVHVTFSQLSVRFIITFFFSISFAKSYSLHLYFLPIIPQLRSTLKFDSYLLL